MPALDDCAVLDRETLARFAATVERLGETRPGDRVSTTLLNVEHKKPLILAIKATKSRFACFHAPGSKLIISGHYVKDRGKLDKRGTRAISDAVSAHDDYFRRMNCNSYYRRGEESGEEK